MEFWFERFAFLPAHNTLKMFYFKFKVGVRQLLMGI